MSSNLVVITTGHLGSGHWRIKDLDGLPYLSTPQPFSRRTEYRIGPDQVLNVSVEENLGKKLQVKIDLTDDRYCRAEIYPEFLPKLKAMAQDQRVVPLAESQQTNWLILVTFFFTVCILIEIFK